ncbi:ATP-binding protein [Nitratireductor luteus]|uniref:ATP-binding protein n=1 Tax=Nitratireductor luteus TaxID=2976980 RepID=UPI002240DB8D|nr:ATP-binding protein [Nitratireductor luteus]
MKGAEGKQDLFDHAPPAASALLEALRGLGYSTEAAIADLIDNSIAAGGRKIRIDFFWQGPASIVRIIDDGRGMDDRTLFEAMRPGGRHPLLVRDPEDLGRFGLGLKTASLSQGRVLAVVSRTAGGSESRRSWDLDYVAQADEWRLLRNIPADVQEHAAIPGTASGTAVVIGRLDRLLGEDMQSEAARTRFRSIARRVERHLAMTFHRFLEGPQPRLEIVIGGGDKGARIAPWDPFLQWHPATTLTPVERLAHRSGEIEVQGFVLPHRDKMTADQVEEAAGPDGWLGHEGFFVYRNRRLLVAGGWLGLGAGRRWTRDDVHRLARLRLDLPNSGDGDWKVDIRKSTATPPSTLRPRLQGLAEQVRRDAREVFAWRGGRSTRQPRAPIARVWNTVETARGTVYRIDRAHPAVQRALDATGASRRLSEEMLTVIEAGLPVQRIWLDVAEQGDLPPSPASMPAEEAAAMQSLYRHMREGLGLSAADARRRLLSIEPFAGYPAAVARIADETTQRHD